MDIEGIVVTRPSDILENRSHMQLKKWLPDASVFIYGSSYASCVGPFPRRISNVTSSC